MDTTNVFNSSLRKAYTSLIDVVIPDHKFYDPSLHEEFHREFLKIKHEQSRLGCTLTAFVVLVGFIIDWIVYRHDTEFVILEGVRAASFAWLLVMTVLHHIKPRIPATLLGIGWILPTHLAVALMIYLTDGPQSPYWFGFIMLNTGVGYLSAFTRGEIALYNIFALSVYMLACFFHLERYDLHFNAITNMVMMVTWSMVCLAGSHFGTRTLYKMYEVAIGFQRRDQFKTDFLSRVTHELKTPLSLISGPLDDLCSKKQGEVWTETDHRNLLLAKLNSDRLLHEVNRLLDLVRYENDSQLSRPRPTIDLTQELSSLAVQFEHLMRQSGKEYIVRIESDEFLADISERDFAVAVSNLLTNANKFTPSGGLVSLSARNEGDCFLIDVADTGIGIPQGEIERVFEYFYQVDESSRRRFLGTGIGLHSVKQIMDACQGTVTIDSKLDHGTTVHLSFPRSPQAKASQISTSSKAFIDQIVQLAIRSPIAKSHLTNTDSNLPAPIPKGKPVVIVISNESSQDAIRQQLGNAPCNVHCFPSVSAFKRYYPPRLDIVLYDPEIVSRAELQKLFDPLRVRILELSRISEIHGYLIIPAGSVIEQAKLTRVVILDDEPHMNQYLVNLLGETYQITSFDDSREALSAIESIKPAVVITDYMMPAMNGLDFYKELSKKSFTIRPRVIMLTAREDHDLRMQALTVGINDIQGKPFRSDELMARIALQAEAWHLETELNEKITQVSTILAENQSLNRQLLEETRATTTHFVATFVLHEFANPLHSISLLLRHLQSQLPKDDWAAATVDELRGLIHRIQQVFDILRKLAHESPIKPTRFSLRSVIEKVLSQYSERIDLSHIGLEVDPGLVIQGVEAHVMRSVYYLLAHSITHADKHHRELDIHFYTAMTIDQKLQIFIRDTAGHRTAEELELISDPFYSTKLPINNDQIVLSMARYHVEQLGGTLRIQSDPNGVAFIVELKLPVEVPAFA